MSLLALAMRCRFSQRSDSIGLAGRLDYCGNLLRVKSIEKVLLHGSAVAHFCEKVRFG